MGNTDSGKSAANVNPPALVGNALLWVFNHTVKPVVNFAVTGVTAPIRGLASSGTGTALVNIATPAPLAGKAQQLLNASNGLATPAKITKITKKSGGFASHATGGPGGNVGPAAGDAAPNTTAANIIWNLPPHNSSLPIRPASWRYDEVTNNTIDHSTRRARLWPYYGIQKNDSNLVGSSDWNWGFQFPWNPETFAVSVHRNQDKAPDTSSMFNGLTGNYMGQESISFKIVLDRTNDFAALKSGNLSTNSYSSSSPTTVDTSTLAGIAAASGGVDAKKVQELANMGTLHDIEHIFRMINGAGGDYVDVKTNTTKNAPMWKNGLGRTTADTSYLATTIIALQLGPSNEYNLSYIGWVESLNIVHTAFTEDMIPIRSTVDVQLVGFTSHTY